MWWPLVFVYALDSLLSRHLTGSTTNISLCACSFLAPLSIASSILMRSMRLWCLGEWFPGWPVRGFMRCCGIWSMGIEIWIFKSIIIKQKRIIQMLINIMANYLLYNILNFFSILLLPSYIFISANESCHVMSMKLFSIISKCVDILPWTLWSIEAGV